MYACAHQGQIAAVATVAVEIPTRLHPTPFDPGLSRDQGPAGPNQNGTVGLSLPGVKVRGTELNMESWARLDHCRTAPRRGRIGSRVIEQLWSGCTGATVVELDTIIGGGHS